MTFMPVMVRANSRAEARAAACGQPSQFALTPPAPGRSMISTPRNPTRAAAIRSGPIRSRSTKPASGTSHRVRVNDRALASANGSS
jgi:hypothetical protein